jgi:hypothetical protein
LIRAGAGGEISGREDEGRLYIKGYC